MGLIYSPLVANLLMKFTRLVKSGEYEVRLNDLSSQFKHVDENTLLDCLKNLADLSPSPILNLEEDKIKLNKFDSQYHVTPYCDFSGLEEIDFIEENGSGGCQDFKGTRAQ